VKHLVLVAGNISAGKTSLTERVGTRLGWRTAFESVGDNPYLAEFYANMQEWAFHLQVFFLGHRARQHLELAKDPESAIADRSIYEDAYIFARALHHLGNLNERDYKSYRAVFDLVTGGLPKPDLLLYLRAPVEVLMARIRRRGREMERGISADYLRLLDRFYEEWLAVYDLSPVLMIRTDDLDFVHRPEDLDIVVERIRARLAGREEIVFGTPE
jgi:deoxyadenosine/deoxycytidine kinase